MPRENNPNFLLKARKLPAKSSDLFFSQPSIQELALPLAKPVLATIPPAEFHCETGSVEPVEAGNAKSGQWRAEDQTRLYQLHNQLGNKWSQMAKSFPGKSDNCVKNHFFSRLRMSLRHINKQLPSHATTRPAKMHVIYKIASTCEERFNPESEYTSAFILFAYQLKNKILGFLGENRHSLEYVQQTLEEVHLFNKQFKMRDEILKVPKVTRVKATRERHSQDDEEKADQEFVGEPNLTWMESGLVEGPSSKVQTWTTLQTILQQSSRLSQLLCSEPERMQIRMVQTSEYLFNDQNMSINDWMDAINNDPTFAPACF